MTSPHPADTRLPHRFLALLAIVLAVGAGAGACGNSDQDGPVDGSTGGRGATTSTTVPPPTTVAGPPSEETVLERVARITGKITPKSVSASPSGLVSAQSMMYSHNVTFYDPVTRKLVATIPDRVDLADFGIDGHPGTSRGAPVEAVFTADGRHEYVSNYSMYGQGFGPEGLDSCHAGDGTDTSYVYRLDVATHKIDQVIHVGAVPKFMAITPDGRYLLVSNWCSWSLSVVDIAKATEYKRIPLGGRYPRGIVVSPDSRTAYVALMGSDRIVAVDLATSDVTTFASTGSGPRHIVTSPDAQYLYVTNNSSGTVTKVKRSNGEVVATHHTGSEPRSMAISADGTALYVVNYDSSSVSKLRSSDLSVLDTARTDYHPIGIAYEPTTRSVWVACYGGSILVFSDTGRS